MDKNWKEELAKFKIPQARLLYMIFYLFKANEINYQQKYKLKELVMLEDNGLNNCYNNFEKDKNLNKLIIDLKTIYDENKTEVIGDHLKIKTGKDVIKKARANQVVIEEVSNFIIIV